MATAEQKPISEDKNQTSFEEDLKKLKEEKETLLKQNEEMQQWILSNYKKAPQDAPSKQPLEDDDLAEGRHIKELTKKVSQLEEAQKQYQQKTIPERLANKYSDFKEVVTEEALNRLEKEEPEIFSALKSSKDVFDAGVASYKTIKALGKKEKAMVEENAKKPLSVQSIKGQDTIETMGLNDTLTKDLKNRLYAEAREAAKG